MKSCLHGGKRDLHIESILKLYIPYKAVSQYIKECTSGEWSGQPSLKSDPVPSVGGAGQIQSVPGNKLLAYT